MEVILFLHRDARLSALWLHDKLSIKVLAETKQLLSTAIQLLSLENIEDLTAPFIGHKHLDWVMQSTEHFEWVYSYYLMLVEQSKLISFKNYADYKFELAVKRNKWIIPTARWQDPPIFVPPDCDVDDFVESYRLYYGRCRCSVGAFRRVKPPPWLSLTAPDSWL